MTAQQAKFTFDQFALTSGQLVQGLDGWCLTAVGQSTDPVLIAAWQEEYTLLLPSRQQLEAAGLTCLSALMRLPNAQECEPETDGHITGPDVWVCDGGDPYFGMYIRTSDDLSIVLDTDGCEAKFEEKHWPAIKAVFQHAEALTAWLRQWTIEEKGGVSKETRDETTGTGRIHD